MSNALFSALRPAQLDAAVTFDKLMNSTLDPDFDVWVATDECWDKKKWTMELTRKDVKAVIVTDGPSFPTNVVGVFVYEFGKFGYRIVKWVANSNHKSAPHFFFSILVWMMKKMNENEKPALSLVIPDDMAQLKQFTTNGWTVKLLRNHFAAGCDGWEVSIKNKKPRFVETEG